MNQLYKHILVILGLLLFISSQSISQSKWAPIMMGDITAFVPNTSSVQATKEYYVPNATVTVNVQGYISGDGDWVGIYRKGTSTAWSNVVAWNWVSKNGTVLLVRDKKPMPAGEYEVRLFFHNNYDMKAFDSFVVRKYPISTVKTTYNENETVSVNVQMALSGDEDWIGIFPKDSDSSWENVIKWNWVNGVGMVTLDRTDFVANSNMPAGEYEVRLFYHNEYGADAVVRATYGFSVVDNDLYAYPPDTTLTAVGVEDLARPEKTAFEDITKASVIDPAFGTTITRMHYQGDSGYSGYLYPKSQSWNSDMTYVYLGYRLFNADTLVESDITKGLAVDGANGTYRKLGYSDSGIFRWSHVNPKVFYTLQGVNALTFTKNTIVGTDVEHEVLFDFNNNDFELIQLGNGESHIDRFDKYVVFMAKKTNNDQMFAVLCNIQQPNVACKIKALVDSTWGYVYVDDNNDGIYDTRSLFDWIDISPNGDRIVVNRTVNGAALVDQNVKSVETAIYMYDLNFENEQKIANTGGHGDLGLDENGNQVYVQFEWLQDHYGVFSYNLDAPEGQRETKVLSSTYGGGHISCQNYNRPGWCYLSTKYYGGEYNEVFALKLDGSETVNRFVKARSTAGPYAGVSPDGKRVVYLSNWDEDNKSIYNMYHVGLKK